MNKLINARSSTKLKDSLDDQLVLAVVVEVIGGELLALVEWLQRGRVNAHLMSLQ